MRTSFLLRAPERLSAFNTCNLPDAASPIMKKTAPNRAFEFVSYEGSKLPDSPNVRDLVRRRAMKHNAAIRKANGGYGKHNIRQIPLILLDSDREADAKPPSCARRPRTGAWSFWPASYRSRGSVTGCMARRRQPDQSSTRPARERRANGPSPSRQSNIVRIFSPEPGDPTDIAPSRCQHQIPISTPT